MARMTLLEVVQSVLNSMDSDEVNSISDTVESEQVAMIAKEVFFELLSQGDWPHLNRVMELESVSDVTQPTLLKLPTLVREIHKVKYDVTTSSDPNTKREKITYMDPQDFIDLLDSRDSSDSTVTSYTTDDNVELLIRTDKMPDYWTSFDDVYLVFDSYDSSEESTLQGGKSVIFAEKEPSWTATDTSIPDLPGKMFPMYLARVKVKAHAYLKDAPSSTDMQEEQRGTSRQKRHLKRAKDTYRKTNWGR